MVSLGWLGAYWLRYALNDVLGVPINPFDWYLRALPIIVFPWVFSCWLFGIYRSARMRTGVDEFGALLRGVALGPRAALNPRNWPEIYRSIAVPLVVRAVKVSGEAALAAEARGLRLGPEPGFPEGIRVRRQEESQ